MMKRFFRIIFLFLITGILLTSCHETKTNQQTSKKGLENHPPSGMINNMSGLMHNMKMGKDTRISLHLPPAKAQHQLMNMRSHLAAVQTIVFLLSKNKFDKASAVAHARLGLTPEMKKMCSSFGNPDFEKLGFGFHKSADSLGDILKTGDKNKALLALSTTLNRCVHCHATFRQ